MPVTVAWDAEIAGWFAADRLAASDHRIIRRVARAVAAKGERLARRLDARRRAAMKA